MSELYIGKVMNNIDPDFEGKVQIYIEPLFHDVNPLFYPWFRQCREMSSNIPEIDDLVWCWFEDEKYYKKGFYGSKVNLKGLHEHNETIGSMTDIYPNVKYLKLKNGLAIAVSSNFTEASILVGDAEVYISPLGEITIKSGKVKIDGSGSGELEVNGSVLPTSPGGPFCAVPGGKCLFTGADITGNKVSGT